MHLDMLAERRSSCCGGIFELQIFFQIGARVLVAEVSLRQLIVLDLIDQ